MVSLLILVYFQCDVDLLTFVTAFFNGRLFH